MSYLAALLLSLTASLIADLIVVGGLALLKDYLDHLKRERYEHSHDFQSTGRCRSPRQK